MTKKGSDSSLTIIIVIVVCLIFSSIIGGLVWFFREDLFGTEDTESPSPGPSGTPPSETPTASGETPPSETPTAGGETPTAGGETPTSGGGTPTAGGETPTAGGETPTSGGGTPTAGGGGIPYPSVYTSTSNNLVKLYFDGIDNGRSVDSSMRSSNFTYRLSGNILTLTIASMGGSTVIPYSITGDLMQISYNGDTLVKSVLTIPTSGGPPIPIPFPSLYTADVSNDDKQLTFSSATQGSAKLFNMIDPFTYTINGDILQTSGTFSNGTYRISNGAASLSSFGSNTLFSGFGNIVFTGGTLPPPPPPPPPPPTVALPFPSVYSTGRTSTGIPGLSGIERIYRFDSVSNGREDFIRTLTAGGQTTLTSQFTYSINGTSLRVTVTNSGGTVGNWDYNISGDSRTLTGTGTNRNVLTKQP